MSFNHNPRRIRNRPPQDDITIWADTPWYSFRLPGDNYRRLISMIAITPFSSAPAPVLFTQIQGYSKEKMIMTLCAECFYPRVRVDCIGGMIITPHLGNRRCGIHALQAQHARSAARLAELQTSTERDGGVSAEHFVVALTLSVLNGTFKSLFAGRRLIWRYIDNDQIKTNRYRFTTWDHELAPMEHSLLDFFLSVREPFRCAHAPGCWKSSNPKIEILHPAIQTPFMLTQHDDVSHFRSLTRSIWLHVCGGEWVNIAGIALGMANFPFMPFSRNPVTVPDILAYETLITRGVVPEWKVVIKTFLANTSPSGRRIYRGIVAV